MLDAAMIIPETTPLSTPSTPDASDDEFNEDTTRIYFGPFTSPEKRFAAVVAVPDSQIGCTPGNSRDLAERSSQGSGPSSPVIPASANGVVQTVEHNENQSEDESGERPNVGTPLGGHFPDDDEPSSVLASRLLRAIDNPSPPPSTATLPNDVDEMGAEADRQDEVSFSDDQGPTPLVPTFLPPVIEHQVSTPWSTSAVESEPDLMTFDDQLEPLDSLPTQPAHPLRLPPSPFSFPETSATPPRAKLPHITQPFQGRVDTLVDVHDDDDGAETSALAQSSQENGGDTGSGECTANQLEEPESCGQPCSDHPSPGAAQATALAVALPLTPLRRSSRPRKSATPHTLNYLAASSSSAEVSPAQSTPRSAATRKARKGKERALSPPKPDSDTETRPSARNLPKVNEGLLDVKLQRRYSKSPLRREFARELGSLSPNSVDLLVNLVPPASTTGSSVDLEDSEGVPLLAVTCATPLETQSNPSGGQSPQAPDIEPAVPTRLSSPVRQPITPRRLHVPHSPSKLRLQSASNDDPFRTPARRIPLQQAIAEGHVSPQKLSQMQMTTPAPVNIFTGQAMPVLNMSLKADSSPARRVFVVPPVTDETRARLQSPYKLRQGESASAVNEVAAGKDSQEIPGTSHSSKLPFPLVAEPKTRPSPNAEKGALSKTALVPNGLAASSLKQTSSRIPRKKPYSRPNPVPLVTERGAVSKASKTRVAASLKTSEVTASKKLSSLMPVGATTTAGKRVIRAVDLSKPTASKASFTAHNSSTRTPASSETVLNHSDASGLGNLKRKRLDSKNTPVASSRSAPLRQVTLEAPSSAPGFNRATAPSSIGNNQPTPDAKAVGYTRQKPAVVKFRRVIPSVPPSPSAAEEQSSTTPSPPDVVKEPCLEAETKQLGLSDEEMTLSSPMKENTDQPPIPSSPPTTIPLNSLPSPQPVPFVFVMDPLSPVSEHAALPSLDGVTREAANVRRTGRLRRTVQTQPGSDVFGGDLSTNSSTSRPSHRRRLNTLQNSRVVTDDVFSGMSVTTLKVLTANNTTQNQRYAVAKLETEIVRKEGARPESPAVKIKTIVQRQQEEKVKQREERAARRAKRQGNAADGEGESASDAGYESPTFANDSHDKHLEILPQHRRGAGDEGDYETPQRQNQREVNEKRVKWDRGLYTEVYLDEVILGTKEPPNGNVITKGCLTTAAKTLRLDTMGNVLDPEDPLSDLAQESIVVKKFVYDDDVEVVPQPVTPAVRNTRSKSKKSKS